MKQFPTSQILNNLPKQFFASLVKKVGKYIEAGYDVKLAENGEILLTNKNDPADFSSSTQRVGLVDISNPQLLQNVGDNQYALREDVLAEGATPDRWIRQIDMNAAGTAKLRQGFLEASNVDLTKEMSELMISQRGFQMNSRALSFADQMMGVANGIINR